MIKISGNVGKSVIVDAIKKYDNTRVYSYDKELIPVMESYHINSDECSMSTLMVMCATAGTTSAKVCVRFVF